jgi:hypothetical protein
MDTSVSLIDPAIILQALGKAAPADVKVILA